MAAASLRNQLFLFATALVLVPGTLYGALTLSSGRAALSELVGRQLLDQASGSADLLALQLRAERARLRALAAQEVMREIRIADLDKRIATLLRATRGSCPACRELAVLDHDGRVVAASDPRRLGAPTAPWLGSARLPFGDGVAFDGPHPDPDDADGPPRLLTLRAPVADPDDAGRALGELVMVLDWSQSTRIATDARGALRALGDAAEVLVVAEDGRVIAANRAVRLGARFALRVPGTDGRTPASYADPATDALVARAALPADLPRWTLVAALPLEIAFAPVTRNAQWLAVTLAATLLVALALAVLAARRITGPLSDLARAAEAVGQGVRPAPPVPVRSQDEVGTLALAFNRMTTDLVRAEHELVTAAKFSFAGELAAGVAHEVRTPLGVLRSAAQMLRRTLAPADAESRELLNLLPAEVDRIDRVVTALLELGRPRELKAEPTPLAPLLFRAAEFVAAQAREKGIALERRPADGEPVALCDPELIYQVALNLLVNAVQVLEPGGRIELEVLPDRAGRTGFVVRDDGPGIPAADRARIFEPFVSHRAGGTGLGLTFVQRVILEHRGQVTVECGAERGTTFRIELPAATEAP